MRIWNEIFRRRHFIINTTQFILNKGLNSVVPLFLIPFYNRIYGVEQFGLLVYVQSAMTLFMLLTDYGFNVTGTREASIAGTRKRLLSQLLFSIYSVKGILILGCYLIMAILYILGGYSLEITLLYIATFSAFAFQSLTPFWFFQGIKKNYIITLINLVSKLLLLFLVYNFIVLGSDLILVPMFEFYSYLASFIICNLILLIYLRKSLVPPSISSIRNQMKSGRYIFVYSLLNWAIVSGSIIIAEKYLSATELGYYGNFMRIMYYAFAVMQPISLALFPYFTTSKNEIEETKLSLKITSLKFYAILIFIFLVAGNLLIKPFLFLFYDQNFLAGMEEYTSTIYYLFFWVSLVSINYFIGLQFLVAISDDRNYLKYYFINAFVTIICLFALTPRYALFGAAISLVAGEAIMLALLTNYIRKSIKLQTLKNVNEF